MDNAVALVQAYLRVNGYFTVAEYPVVEAMRRGGYRSATDLDILAFRFAGAGRQLAAGVGGESRHRFVPDPELGIEAEQSDMLVGEVKEGRGLRHRVLPRSSRARGGLCPAAGAGSASWDSPLRFPRHLARLSGCAVRGACRRGQGPGRRTAWP